MPQRALANGEVTGGSGNEGWRSRSWLFAVTLLVPPGLAAVLVAVAALQRWTRVRHHVAHRRVFATAVTILAVNAGSATLALLDFDPAARTPANFGIVAAAAWEITIPTPPARPCTNRAATSVGMVGLNAHSTEVGRRRRPRPAAAGGAVLELRDPGATYRILAKAEQVQRIGHNPDATPVDLQALVQQRLGH